MFIPVQVFVEDSKIVAALGCQNPFPARSEVRTYPAEAPVPILKSVTVNLPPTPRALWKLPGLVHVFGAVQVLVELNIPDNEAELTDCHVAFPAEFDVRTYPFTAPFVMVIDDAFIPCKNVWLLINVPVLFHVCGAVQVLAELSSPVTDCELAFCQVPLPDASAVNT